MRRFPALGVSGVPFVVFAALAVHATGCFEDVLRVEAPEGAGIEDLINGVLGDHHPLRRVRHRQRLVQHAVEDPDDPSPRTRTGHKAQRQYPSTAYRQAAHSSLEDRNRAKRE